MLPSVDSLKALQKEELPRYISKLVKDTAKQGKFRLALDRDVYKKVSIGFILKGFGGVDSFYSEEEGKAVISWDKPTHVECPCCKASNVCNNNIFGIRVPSAFEMFNLSMSKFPELILVENSKGKDSIDLSEFRLSYLIANHFRDSGYKVTMKICGDLYFYNLPGVHGEIVGTCSWL